MDRWAEHYLELYSKDNSISQDRSIELPLWPCNQPELDRAQTLKELNKAIDALAARKAPGQDCIPSDVIKCRKTVLLDHFTYLGPTVSSDLSLDLEIDWMLGKADGTMAKLHKRVWPNSSLRLKTKIKVSKACIISTPLYESESWTT